MEIDRRARAGAAALVAAAVLLVTGVVAVPAGAQDATPDPAGRTERSERRREARRELLATAAEAVGIEPADLRGRLRDGATVAEVAEEEGVDPQTVVDALVAQVEARITRAVDEGRLDGVRAERLRERAAERIARFVEEGRPRRR